MIFQANKRGASSSFKEIQIEIENPDGSEH